MGVNFFGMRGRSKYVEIGQLVFLVGGGGHNSPIPTTLDLLLAGKSAKPVFEGTLKA